MAQTGSGQASQEPAPTATVDGAATEVAQIPLLRCERPNDAQDATALAANKTARATRWMALFTALTFIGTALAGWMNVENARDNTRADLRAYVNADLAKWDKGPSLRVRVRCVNQGKTPAYHVTHQTAVQWGPHEVTPSSFGYLSGKLQTETRSFTLGAGTPCWTTPDPQTITPGQLKAILDGQAPLSVYGVLAYTDRFGSHHTSRFCFSYDKDAGDLVVCPGNLNASD